jgi:hypothetical protein
MRTLLSIIASVSLALLGIAIDVRSVTAQGNCLDAYEPNNNLSQAKSLRAGQIQATICPTRDIDVYQFNVSAGDNVYLRLVNLTADLDMVLYSKNKNVEIGRSENYDYESEEINWISNGSDTLYVVIYAYDNSTSSTRPYTLVLGTVPKLDLDSTVSDPSAQLGNLRSKMSERDWANLMEFAKYAIDTTKCMKAIHTWELTGIINATTSDAAACGGMLNEIIKVTGKYISPDPVGGDRADLDLNAYCRYKYGSGVIAVASNRQDAYSWGCYRGNRYLGGIDMAEACRIQHPDLITVNMGDRWNAYSWFCSD